MVKRDSAPVGFPCWVDVFTSDTDKARAFYGDLFGWTSEDPNPDMGGYFNFSKDGVLVAGGNGNDGASGVPDRWSVYLASDDAKATADTAAAKGGQVLQPAVDIPDVGSFALLADVGGAAIGVWQPGTHKGFGVLAEPGAPAWFELHTRDYEASVQFYRDVFGWDTHLASDVPEFRYTTLGEGESAAAGIMDASAFLPDGVPATWSVYFAVDDTDVALAKIVDLGGAITQPAEDTPFGRLASATDTTGTAFKLVAGG